MTSFFFPGNFQDLSIQDEIEETPVSWQDKYKPKTTKDIIGNKETIAQIKSFLEPYNKVNDIIEERRRNPNVLCSFCNNPYSKLLQDDSRSLLNKNISRQDESDTVSTTKNTQCLHCINPYQTTIMRPNILISGSNGIGKTSIVDLVLKEMGFRAIPINLQSIHVNKKNANEEAINKAANNKNHTRSIANYFNFVNANVSENITNNRVALILDNVTNISVPKEKTAIKEIVKYNNKMKRYPIIIIATLKHRKVVNELRKALTYGGKKKKGAKIIYWEDSEKKPNELIIKPPDESDIKQFIIKIIEREGIKIHWPDSENICNWLIQYSQYDIRRLLIILEEFYFVYKNKKINMKLLSNHNFISKTKDIDPGIFESTKKLLNNYENLETALQIYSEDRATNPLMVHENFPINIKVQYANMPIDKKIELMHNIYAAISESDKVDGLIYSMQCWNLQQVHGFYSCALPSFLINEDQEKMSMYEKYEYTKEYNKTSSKKSNYKTIKLIRENKKLKNVSVENFMFMGSIMRGLIEAQNMEKLAELMVAYDIPTVKIMLSIANIDQTVKPKEPGCLSSYDEFVDIIQNIKAMKKNDEFLHPFQMLNFKNEAGEYYNNVLEVVSINSSIDKAKPKEKVFMNKQQEDTLTDLLDKAYGRPSSKPVRKRAIVVKKK